MAALLRAGLAGSADMGERSIQYAAPTRAAPAPRPPGREPRNAGYAYQQAIASASAREMSLALLVDSVALDPAPDQQLVLTIGSSAQ